jgi:hypothetical protein
MSWNPFRSNAKPPSPPSPPLPPAGFEPQIVGVPDRWALIYDDAQPKIIECKTGRVIADGDLFGKDKEALRELVEAANAGWRMRQP